MMITRLTSLLALAALTASAQFTLVETGGSFRLDAVNWAVTFNGGRAIGLNELSGFGHHIVEINDNFYGNSSSWIGANDLESSWVGVVLAGPTTVSSFALGRDNTGVFSDRANDLYTIQYTTDTVTVGTATAANWLTVGALDYFSAPPASPALRHLYNLNTPLTGVTAFRITTFGGPTAGLAIDELEVYSTAAIPEPSTYAAIAGALGLGLVVWRRRVAAHS